MVGKGYEDDVIIGYAPHGVVKGLEVPFCTFLPRWKQKFVKI